MAVKPIPDGYVGNIPYLTVDDGKRAIEFYKRAFGATERGRLAAPDGRIGHAELVIGDAVVMLCDAFPGYRTPTEVGGTTVQILRFVEDVDAVVQRAADAGATVTQEPADQFWGDRTGQLTDPYGHVWIFATRVEDLSPEEIGARSREVFASMA